MTATESAHVAALTHACCLWPADNDRRLILADALEEAGQGEKAEFIRVQCELAKLRAGPTGPVPDDNAWLMFGMEYRLLSRRAQELGGLPNGPCLHCDWHAPMTHDGWMWEFRNGFPDRVTCACAMWQKHGPTSVVVTPVVQVVLSDKEPSEFRTLGNDVVHFCWFRRDETGGDADPSSIPRALFSMLPDGAKYRKDFDTRQVAFDALSAACIAWARHEAGLDVPCEECYPQAGFPAADCVRCGNTRWRVNDDD